MISHYVSNRSDTMRIREELLQSHLPFDKKSLRNIYPVVQVHNAGGALPLHTHNNMTNIISIYLNDLSDDQGGKHHWIDNDGIDHYHTPKERMMLTYQYPEGTESHVHGVTELKYGDRWSLQIFCIPTSFMKSQDRLGLDGWTSKWHG